MEARTRRQCWTLVRAIVLCSCYLSSGATTRGDGLVYQLPPDGSAASFDLTITRDENGQEREFATGSLTMSSVGQTQEGGRKWRWIEFTMNMTFGGRGRTIVAKLLVPERDLREGGQPFAKASKIWFRQGDQETKQLTDRASDDIGPLPSFLAGPLQDTRDLPAQ